MSQAEIDQALDNLELEAEEEEVVEDIIEDVVEDVEEVVEGKPPGFIGYDEWIAKGKDPADYRGEKAYKAQYEALKEVRELKASMAQVTTTVSDWKQQQIDDMNARIEQARAEAVAELAKAKENEDIEAYDAAQTKLNNIKPPIQAPPPPNPVISEFMHKNPILDPASPQFDAEFHKDVEMMHNGTLDKLLGGDRSRQHELTQAQIDRSLNLAYSEAKKLHADKFVSRKANRSTVPSGQKRQPNKGGDTVTRLKSFKTDSKNPRDNNAAMDVYNMLKEKDPEAAEKFAQSMVGES